MINEFPTECKEKRKEFDKKLIDKLSRNDMTNKQSVEELEEELISSADNFASEKWMDRKLKAYKQAVREEAIKDVIENLPLVLETIQSHLKQE